MFSVFMFSTSLAPGCRTAPGQLPLLALPLSAAALALSAGLGRLLWHTRHPKEHGLLAGSTVGSSMALAALPLVQAFVGLPGLRTALLAGLVNILAVWVASFMLFSMAGPAFPEAQQHDDGGSYRGESKGMLKEGFGVYTYPSGARYEGACWLPRLLLLLLTFVLEGGIRPYCCSRWGSKPTGSCNGCSRPAGEWRNNLKEGRGVYHFPKGGVYEGEWRCGAMAGVGVRTISSGQVRAGFWQDGKLQSELEEWQCALAVEGAAEAATAARRIKVGGGWAEALQQLLAQPAAWAYGLAAVLLVLGKPLTPTLDAVTAQLAGAHAPLALLALGLGLDVALPPKRQVGAGCGRVHAPHCPRCCLHAQTSLLVLILAQ